MGRALQSFGRVLHRIRCFRRPVDGASLRGDAEGLPAAYIASSYVPLGLEAGREDDSPQQRHVQAGIHSAHHLPRMPMRESAARAGLDTFHKQIRQASTAQGGDDHGNDQEVAQQLGNFGKKHGWECLSTPTVAFHVFGSHSYDCRLPKHTTRLAEP